jgi:hypothetical protein
MHNNCSSSLHCALCGTALPRGVRVALFASPESDEAVLGDFCSVGHAMDALEDLAGATTVPDTLFLGVRVDRNDHDGSALAAIMADIVSRAVRTAMAGEEALEPPPRQPSSQLN